MLIPSLFLYCLFFNYCIFTFILFERQTDRKVDLPSVDSLPNAPQTSKSGPGPNQQPSTQCRSPKWMVWTSVEASLAAFQGCISRKVGEEGSQDSNPKTPLWHVGILRSVSTTMPNAYPLWGLFLNLILFLERDRALSCTDSLPNAHNT